MSTRFKTQFNFKEFPRKLEITGTRISKTIPDQSLSVKDIMRRYSQGLSFGNIKVGEYDEANPDFLPDFSRMDLSEIHDFKLWVSEQLKEKKEEVTRQMEESRKKQTLDLYKKWKEKEDSEKPIVVDDSTPS